MKTNLLIQDNEDLVKLVTYSYYSNYSHIMDDIKEAAYAGLWNAAKHFDTTRKIPFRNYATECMKNAINLSIRRYNNKFGMVDFGCEIEEKTFLAGPEKIALDNLYIEHVLKILCNSLSIKEIKAFCLSRLGVSQLEMEKYLHNKQSYISRVIRKANRNFISKVKCEEPLEESIKVNVSFKYVTFQFRNGRKVRCLKNQDEVFKAILHNIC